MFPPIEELDTLRGTPIVTIAAKTIAAGSSFVLDVPVADGNQLDIELTIAADFTHAGVMAGVSVLEGNGQTNGTYVYLGSNPANANPEGINLLTLNNGGKQGQSVIGTSTSSVALRVIVDRSAVEAYAAGGRGVATHRVYPTLTERGVSLKNTGTVDVTISCTIYPMAVANPPAMDDLLTIE
jgi:sucrose-6-phosphate hydrolase SacC (GH32 family)